MALFQLLLSSIYFELAARRTKAASPYTRVMSVYVHFWRSALAIQFLADPNNASAHANLKGNKNHKLLVVT